MQSLTTSTRSVDCSDPDQLAQDFVMPQPGRHQLLPSHTAEPSQTVFRTNLKVPWDWPRNWGRIAIRTTLPFPCRASTTASLPSTTRSPETQPEASRSLAAKRATERISRSPLLKLSAT